MSSPKKQQCEEIDLACAQTSPISVKQRKQETSARRLRLTECIADLGSFMTNWPNPVTFCEGTFRQGWNQDFLKEGVGDGGCR